MWHKVFEKILRVEKIYVTIANFVFLAFLQNIRFSITTRSQKNFHLIIIERTGQENKTLLEEPKT